MKKYKLELIVFLSGAIGMGLELVAARVLSPYVGSSNVVWTSIIGIILLSMSLGYWIGGKKADKDVNVNQLSVLLLLAAVATSIIPLFETLIVKQFAEKINNLTIAAMLCAMVLFSLPCFILAMISPFALKLKCKNTTNIGTLSGKISSLNTVGSIVGTFFIGFILIPNIGVRNINMGITLILLFMSLLIRENWNFKNICYLVLFIVLLLSIIVVGKVFFKLSNPEIILDVDSQYSRIWVMETVENGIANKIIQVDTAWQSVVFAKTGTIVSSYLNYYDLFDYFNKDARNVLLIGGAAYAYPTHFLRSFSDKKIDVVEIDRTMTKIAVQEFNLDIDNPRLKVYTQDGRSFLNYSNNKYDVIMIDAFKGTNFPFELATYEALVNAKNMLNENGVIITNIPSSLEGNDSELMKYEYATYREVFDDIMIFAVQTDDINVKQNLMLIGVKGNPKISDSKYSRYLKYLETEIKDYSSDKKIVTDDYAPVGI